MATFSGSFGVIVIYWYCVRGNAMNLCELESMEAKVKYLLYLVQIIEGLKLCHVEVVRLNCYKLIRRTVNM